MASFKRSAIVAASAAAVFLPATAAAAGDPEIPAEGWEYSEQWDFVQDEYTAEAHEETTEQLNEHFEDWTFDASLEMKRLQNYYIDGENETPVQRKFRADFYVDQTGEGLETALYLPGGISTGIQDVTGGDDFDMHYLVHCRESDTECGEEELEDGTVVAWTTDGTYVEAVLRGRHRGHRLVGRHERRGGRRLGRADHGARRRPRHRAGLGGPGSRLGVLKARK